MGTVVYLDNAATTRPFPEAVEAAARAMAAGFGNPSSRHRLGLEAARVVDAARVSLAAMIGAEPAEITFTGGGSEANNLVLKGAAWAYGRVARGLVVGAVEHPSVLETARWLAAAGRFELTLVPVGRDGRARPEDVLAAVDEDTLLVSLMHVNNETGAVQPVGEVGRGLRGLKATAGKRKGLPLFHVDAVQSLGRLGIDVRALGIDLLTASAHKVHGPKGVGAVFARDGVRLVPLVHGGGQEAGRRSGTENVPGIAGFGAALERLAGAGPAETAARLDVMRRRLVEIVREGWPGVVVNGPAPAEPGTSSPETAPAVAPHILSLSFPGVPGEVLQHHLEERGLFVSTGSACSSRHDGRPSHVLEAMGLGPGIASSAIRVSFSVLDQAEEIERAGRIIVEVVRSLARAAGGGPRGRPHRGPARPGAGAESR